ncbi:MAG: hypothetical protein ACOYOL_04080 [Chthoniobacterales bacterium]|jgi:hypothetical protein
MINVNTSTLRRALALQLKIETLQRELARLLGQKFVPATGGLPGEDATVLPARGGRKPGRRAKRPKAPKAAKRVSALKGKPRSVSPSGPLGPAIIKVMQRAGGPLNIDAVLQGLADDNYIWNVSDPKKNLAARIYKTKGVHKVAPGLFDLVHRG